MRVVTGIEAFTRPRKIDTAKLPPLDRMQRIYSKYWSPKRQRELDTCPIPRLRFGHWYEMGDRPVRVTERSEASAHTGSRRLMSATPAEAPCGE
jgi:hypothetical protein